MILAEEVKSLEDKFASMRNTTDYDFPPNWGLMTPEQKDRWYKQERAFRQAVKQDTAWGRRAREEMSDSEYRVDEELE